MRPVGFEEDVRRGCGEVLEALLALGELPEPPAAFGVAGDELVAVPDEKHRPGHHRDQLDQGFGFHERPVVGDLPKRQQNQARRVDRHPRHEDGLYHVVEHRAVKCRSVHVKDAHEVEGSALHRRHGEGEDQNGQCACRADQNLDPHEPADRLFILGGPAEDLPPNQEFGDFGCQAQPVAQDRGRGFPGEAMCRWSHR